MNEATVRALIRRFGGGSGLVADGDYGDISITGGVWSIDAGVVGTTEIADGAVTFAKMNGAAVITSGEVLRSNDNDTSLPTSAAVIDALGPQLQTAQSATGSNTVFDFTGIPTWVNRITVMGRGLQTSGTSLWLIRVGDGAIVSSGYLGAVGQIAGTSAASANGTSNFPITQAKVAADVIRFKATIDRFSGNIWVFTCISALSSSSRATFSASEITLTGDLDRVRLTTVNGTDTFNAGSVNISWE